MDEVAEEALVSRATAYRYFRNVNALLLEAPIDAAVGDPSDIFAGDTSEDPEIRIDKAEAFIHATVVENEPQLRIMMANSIGRDLEKDSLPARQNRRTPLIEAALAPSRKNFPKDTYENLCAALAMIIGPESLIVCRDVIDLDSESARRAKSWAVRALVRTALEDSS
jgi:AcrR family transcriptional regulator